MVREVGGERRQVGSHSTTRKGALALVVGAVAHEREKAAAAPDRPSRKSGRQYPAVADRGLSLSA
ncbi:hypothetical protein OTB20_23850 [Streptomyces sp. H27-H1]|uniref:hypothetical protein n=1 Tax=Streptomyces sp. H27-H1 TaxID=2996461 RepID=UPI00226DFBD0|nr:hypothetical protein [Streptomyces sp. H27-H1]MCY0929175.1 hypothetical protein [Streptomyces sp. H27-H1]